MPSDPTTSVQDRPAPLAGFLAYAEREAAQRAKSVHPGMTRLQDGELTALLDVLRREVGAVIGVPMAETGR